MLENSIDEAIYRCENIITEHRKKSSTFLTLIIGVSVIFIAAAATPFVSQYFIGSSPGYSPTENFFIQRLNTDTNLPYPIYDSLITKAMILQKLLNVKNEANINFDKSFLSRRQPDWGNYIFYGIFILIFSVLTSFYRFHLKEISRQEHFLLGFHRIRIAGNNSTSKYDDEVKISLTKDAFSNDSESKLKKVESPIPGHPTSDLSTALYNKFLDAIDVVIKPKESRQ